VFAFNTWRMAPERPVVFVHGVVSDHRAWEPVRDEIARKYRFIAPTQRYFGTGPWKDDGREYSVATLLLTISPSFVNVTQCGTCSPRWLVFWRSCGRDHGSEKSVAGPQSRFVRGQHDVRAAGGQR